MSARTRTTLSRPATNLSEDHGGDLLRRESLGLAEVLDLDLRAGVIINNLEWPRLDILLDGRVVESATNETPSVLSVLVLSIDFPQYCHSLDIEDSVGRVHSGLVLRGLTNKALLGGEGNE